MTDNPAQIPAPTPVDEVMTLIKTHYGAFPTKEGKQHFIDAIREGMMAFVQQNTQEHRLQDSSSWAPRVIPQETRDFWGLR